MQALVIFSLAFSQQEQGAIFLPERFISLSKRSAAIRDTEVSFGIIEKKESRGLQAIFPIWYLSVGTTLTGRGIVLRTHT
jgi:hypothetical protein